MTDVPESSPRTLPDPPGPHAGRWYADPGPYIADRLGHLQGLVKQYGEVCRFRMGFWDIYLLTHPDHVRQVLVNDHASVTKSKVIKASQTLLGKGLLTSEGPFHRRQRRLMAPAFHRQRIAGYAETMVRHAAALADTWQDGQAIDMHVEMNRVTLAIIGETMFGARTEAAARVVSGALEISFGMLNRLTSPWHFLIGLLQVRENLRFFRARHQLNRIVYGFIAQRHRENVQRDDVLQMLLEARDIEGDGGGMSDRQIRDEVLIIFLAGHETTANALGWTWYLLAKHDAVASRLHDELDRVLGGRLPTLEDVPNLVYTRCVIEESIRLYPPAYVIDRATGSDLAIGGYRIRRGTTIFLSPYLTHRDPRWYPDPERFDPDRWTPEAKAARPKFAYFPFGAGPRVCIGEQFAWTEAILVLATLAQRWRARMASSEAVVPHPLIVLRPKTGIPMRVTRRLPGRANLIHSQDTSF